MANSKQWIWRLALASLWLVAFSPTNVHSLNGPGEPPLPAEAGSQHSSTGRICGDLDETYSSRALACTAAALQADPNLLDRVAQPDYFPRTDPSTRAILSSGLEGLDSSTWVTGSKAPAGWKVSRNTLAVPPIPELARSEPYNRFLAAKIPTQDNLMGYRELTPFRIDPAAPEQYLNLQTILGKDGRYSAEHYNLCGPLAVMATVQRSPKPYFEKLAGQEWAADLLWNGNEGIGILDLERIYRMYGWTTRVYPQFSDSPCQEAPNPGDVVEGNRLLCQARQWLNQGKVLIINGNLVTAKGFGVLIPQGYQAGAENRGTAHWAALLQIITSEDGFSYARIYNSFHNREEFYLWNDLYQTWYLDDGSFYSTLLASPYHFD